MSPSGAARLFADLSGRAPGRLSSAPLPAVRFVPGMALEPGITDLRPGAPGHPGAQTLDPARWRDCHDWLHGVDLYNRGYWWEAHEAWEGPWLAAARARAEHGLLKGLIQVSAGHLKLLAGAPTVARDLWRRGSEHVQSASRGAADELWLGLHWRQWLAALSRYVAADLDRHDPAQFPFLELRQATGPAT